MVAPSETIPSQHLSRLNLTPGALGSASLQPLLNRKNQVTRLEWQPALAQQQDLRMRVDGMGGAARACAGSISCLNDEDMVDVEGDRLEFVKDSDLLHQAAQLMPTTPLNPTILLRSLVVDRPSTTRRQAEFLPANPNFGNCLTTSTGSSSEGSAEASTSYAFWRRGDEFARGTEVGWASVERLSGRTRKGKERAWDEEPLDLSDADVDDGNVLFQPKKERLLAKPTTTPILQLQAAPLEENSTALAVRTHTTISLSHIQHNSHSNNSISTSYEYTGRDLGRRPIADLALGGVGACGRRGQGLIVDVDGALFGWGLELSRGNEGRPEMFKLRKAVKDSGYSGAARLAYAGPRGADALVGLEDAVLLYDLRSPRASSELVTAAQLAHALPPGRDRSPSAIVSLCTPSLSSTPSHVHPVCTTREVMLIDDRMPGRDVLRWKHGRIGKEGRGFDRSLRLMDIPPAERRHEDGARRIALHSRLHPTTSVYTYSSAGLGPTRSVLDPYALEGGNSVKRARSGPWTRNGLAFIPDEDGWSALESGADGSVFTRHFSHSNAPQAKEYLVEHLVDDLKVKLIPERVATVGNKQVREPKLIGLARTLDAVFGRGGGQAEADPLRSRLERAEELLIKAVEEEQDFEGEQGSGGILTAFELLAIARKAGQVDEDEDDDERDPLALPRPSTFRGRGRLAAGRDAPLSGPHQSIIAQASEILNEAAPWSTGLNADSDELVSSDLASMADRAERLRNRYNSQRSSTVANSTACSQLILDTTLSSLLISPRPILATEPSVLAPSNEPFPGSLDPPPLQFSYFRPRAQPKPRVGVLSALMGEEEEEEDEHDWRRANLRSVGVRMLLSEWNVGEDPHEYKWVNPYADDPMFGNSQPDSHSQSQSTLNVPKKLGGKAPSPSPAPAGAGRSFGSTFSSQMPPAFSFQSSHLPTVREEPRSVTFAASQPVGGAGESQSQTQDEGGGAYTQVVPGQWGGRPAKEKKKAKKRMSGF